MPDQKSPPKPSDSPKIDVQFSCEELGGQPVLKKLRIGGQWRLVLEVPIKFTDNEQQAVDKIFLAANRFGLNPRVINGLNTKTSEFTEK